MFSRLYRPLSCAAILLAVSATASVAHASPPALLGERLGAADFEPGPVERQLDRALDADPGQRLPGH